MITQWFFTGIVAAVFLQRLLEMQISRRNQVLLLTVGGKEYGDNALWLVKLVQLSWFAAMLTEVWGFNRPLIPELTAIALLATLTGQLLRYFSMQALGVRWTLPLITLPGTPAVNHGIYTYLRHPNWLGVILEIAAVPLIHGAFLTAISFSIINAFLMAKRVQAEEQALSQDSDYLAMFADRSRFLPLPKSRSLRGVNS